MSHTEAIVFTTLHCCKCGIPYTVPAVWLDRKLDKGKEFFCPNGHSMVFTEPWKSKAKKLKKELAEANKELLAARQELVSLKSKHERLEARVSDNGDTSETADVDGQSVKLTLAEVEKRAIQSYRQRFGPKAGKPVAGKSCTHEADGDQFINLCNREGTKLCTYRIMRNDDGGFRLKFAELRTESV